MAKEDFCFTYYDGDAARDMQHMDRTCRGAYNDLLIMQRKVQGGMLTMSHIKAVLGSDFEKCWPSLEFILKREDDFFYIEWVKNSVEKMKENSKSQAEKIKKYWEDVDAGIIPPPKNGRKKIPNKYQTNTTVLKTNTDKIPIINGNEDGNGNIDLKKGGVGETIQQPEFIPLPQTLVGGMRNDFKAVFPAYYFDEGHNAALLEIAVKIAKERGLNGNITEPVNVEKIRTRWGELSNHIKSEPHFSKYDLTQINKYFSAINQSISNARNENTPQGAIRKNGVPAKSAGAEKLLASFKQELASYQHTGG
jgi:hypothetical protein